MWERNGRPIAVIDAKYRREGDTPDLYRMLAYYTALDLREGRLVYAVGQARSHTIQHARPRIHTWTVDIDQPIHGLQAGIDRIATANHY